MMPSENMQIPECQSNCELNNQTSINSISRGLSRLGFSLELKSLDKAERKLHRSNLDSPRRRPRVMKNNCSSSFCKHLPKIKISLMTKRLKEYALSKLHQFRLDRTANRGSVPRYSITAVSFSRARFENSKGKEMTRWYVEVRHWSHRSWAL